MSTRENKAIVRRFYKETFWGNGDLSVLDDFVAPDFVDRTPVPGLSPDREGLKHVVAMIRSAFADRQGTINHLIADGDTVAAHWTMHAIHGGEFMGIAPTGRQVENTGIDVFRLVDGKIAEAWHVEDNLGLMQQLGVIPESGEAME